MSLSARRAWIEISGSTKPRARREVALRKESVDRNCDSDPVTDKAWASLSARRAWIEIGITMVGPGMMTVALRKESVDRNMSV